MDTTKPLIEQLLRANRVQSAAHIYIHLKRIGVRVTLQQIADSIGVTRGRVWQVVNSLESKKTEEVV